MAEKIIRMGNCTRGQATEPEEPVTESVTTSGNAVEWAFQRVSQYTPHNFPPGGEGWRREKPRPGAVASPEGAQAQRLTRGTAAVDGEELVDALRATVPHAVALLRGASPRLPGGWPSPECWGPAIPDWQVLRNRNWELGIRNRRAKTSGRVDDQFSRHIPDRTANLSGNLSDTTTTCLCLLPSGGGGFLKEVSAVTSLGVPGHTFTDSVRSVFTGITTNQYSCQINDRRGQELRHRWAPLPRHRVNEMEHPGPRRCSPYSSRSGGGIHLRVDVHIPWALGPTSPGGISLVIVWLACTMLHSALFRKKYEINFIS